MLCIGCIGSHVMFVSFPFVVTSVHTPDSFLCMHLVPNGFQILISFECFPFQFHLVKETHAAVTCRTTHTFLLPVYQELFVARGVPYCPSDLSLI